MTDQASRVAAYAEAIAAAEDAHQWFSSHGAGGNHWGCSCNARFEDRHGHGRHLDEVRMSAVMAVADAERNEAYARGYQAAREHWKARAESAEAEVERLGGNLSALLCDLTGGRLSKTTYDGRTMVQEIESYFEESNDAEAAERARDAALAEVTELRMRIATCSGSCRALAVPVTGDTEDASPAADTQGEWERHVSTRCPRMAEHGRIEVVDGKAVNLTPHPCPDCYSIESFWHCIPWERDGRWPARAPEADIDVTVCPDCDQKGRYEGRVRINGRGFYTCPDGHRWQDADEKPTTKGLALIPPTATGDTEDASPAAEDTTPDHERGLYGKYRVERISDPTGKHADCRYFVLDPQHDRHAHAALAFYAAEVESEYPQLADDIDVWLMGAASPTEQATEGGAK